jgi:hypothetical protein
MQQDDESLRDSLLQRHHLRVSAEFVSVTRRQLEAAGSRGTASLEQRVLTVALHTDLAVCGVGGVLTEAAVQESVLRGTHVLQLDQVTDIANNREDRSKLSDLPSRVLRLRLTDGVASVTAMENRRVSQLSVRTPPGAKLVLTDVPISRRILLLSPDNCRLLGGSVKTLCDAQAALRSADAAIGSVDGRQPPVALQPIAVAAAGAGRPPAQPLLSLRPPTVGQPPVRPEAAAQDVPMMAVDSNVPGLIDDDIDMSAFLALESAHLARASKPREVIDLAGTHSFDPDFHDVDDLVRIVSQEPDWESGSEDGARDGKRLRRASNNSSSSSSSSSEKIFPTPPGGASDDDEDDEIEVTQSETNANANVDPDRVESVSVSGSVVAVSCIDLCDDE